MASGIRVISLLPSATDIVAALGLTNNLVGRSHECDADGTSAIQVCSESRISTEQGLTSGEVHVAASTAGAGIWEAAYGMSTPGALIQWALSPYLTYPDQIRELQPDVVLTQVQFSGGATSESEVHQALCEWIGKPVTLLHLDPHSLPQVWEDIQRVGECLSSRHVALDLVARLKDRMAVVSSKSSKSVERGKIIERKRVVCVQWANPLFLAGAWVPELVRLAGGVDLSEEECSNRDGGVEGLEGMGEGGELGDGQKMLWPEWQSVFRKHPNTLVFMICGSNLRESMLEASRVVSEGFLEQMKGVESGVVAVVDGAKLFSRPGPSLVESLEVLAEILHPESHSFGHRGSKWQVLEV